jgi:hypothetical protein
VKCGIAGAEAGFAYQGRKHLIYLLDVTGIHVVMEEKENYTPAMVDTLLYLAAGGKLNYLFYPIPGLGKETTLE